MPSSGIIHALLSHATSTGSRSTALQPLCYLTSILVAGLVAVACWGAQHWVIILLSFLVVIAVIIYLISYVFYAFKNPDALRSEKYTLSKMAIEKNLIGDNTAGLLEIDDSFKSIPAPTLPIKREDVQ